MHDDAPLPPTGLVLHQIRRRYVALALVVVALVLLGILILIRHAKTPTDSGSTETFSAVGGSVLSAVTQVPASIIDAVGVTSPTDAVTPPTPNPASNVWTDAAPGALPHPVVFFYGAEFAPYAAAERWPLVVALSHFGTFGQLGQVQSSPSEIFPGLASFTFWRVGYHSKWVSLQAVERYGDVDPTGARYVSLQQPDATESAAVAEYDTSSTTFPLLDIANRYLLVGSSFSPAPLVGLNQSQIAADLAIPISPVTQAVISSSNEITAAICTVTGQQPAAACDARGVRAADQRMNIVVPAG
jgi:hypothetical protein